MQNQSELCDLTPTWRTIAINGEKYVIEYDYRAYAMAEEATGKSVYELKDDFLNGQITLTNQLLILYSGLLRHHNDFDIEILKNHPRVGSLITQALEPMLEAFFTPLLPCKISNL